VLTVALAACSEAPEAMTEDTTTDTSPTDSSGDTEPPPPPAPATGVTLEIRTNIPGEANDAIMEVVAAFTAETGIEVDFDNPSGYEDLMRTRMATNDLPDIFTTHGWAVIRYGTFLRPLNDQPWASQVSPQIGSVVTDHEGNLMVLPVDIDIAGLVFNRDILDEIGVDPADITHWSDFEDVCEQILAAGYIPIFIGGQDDWMLGQAADWIPPSMFITDDSNNHRDALLDGTFDWSEWGIFVDMLSDWIDRGFFNEDATTADYETLTRILGQGEAAFSFTGNHAAIDAAGFGSANIGMMPLPAYFPGDAPSLIAGESVAFGVWKDTPYEAEALQFLEFVARPENMVKIAQARGNVAGFTGVDVDMGFLTEDFNRWSHIRTFPYFDRVYLPGGMWEDLCNTSLGLFNGTMTRQAVIEHMERSYLSRLDDWFEARGIS
jgi:raffinose/stachyose/melibiose transport system substrate-binding protein